MKEATIKIVDKRIPLTDVEKAMEKVPTGGHIHLSLALPENVKDAQELLGEREETLFKGLMIGWDLKIRSAIRGAFSDLDGTETRITIQENIQQGFNDYVPVFEKVSKAKKAPTLSSARKQTCSVLENQFKGDKEAFKAWLVETGVL